MEYRIYYETSHAASALVDKGDFEPALQMFHDLAHSDISDIDKALMCYNAANVCGKMKRVEDALAWYDAGIAYEQPYMRFLVLEYKAYYLTEQGRDKEALEIYESLYRQPYVTENDKERLWKNITVLKNPRPT
jgi:tetratricopeptide (TPR) repeat protein